MRLLIELILIIVPWTDGINITDINYKNKTKRTLSHDIRNYGEIKPYFINTDNTGSMSPLNGEHNSYLEYKPFTLVTEPQVIKEYDSVKQQTGNIQGANQEMLYELQRIPNNSPHMMGSPHSHVKVSQPANYFIGDLNNNVQNQRHKEYVSTAVNIDQTRLPPETVILPKHNQYYVPMYAHNGLPYANRITPYSTSQQVTPKRYISTDGKSMYGLNSPYLLQNANMRVNSLSMLPNNYVQNYKHQEGIQTQPINHYTNFTDVPRQSVTIANVPPNDNKFTRPYKQQQEHAKELSNIPLKTDETIKYKNNHEIKLSKGHDIHELIKKEKPVSKDEDLDEDQDEHENVFSSYYDEEDSSDEELDDTEEEDVDKRPTKYAPKKFPKNNLKSGILNINGCDFGNINQESDKMDKTIHKHSRKPKILHKSLRYSRIKNKSPGSESLEGRYSENIPVTHKRKVFKQKWYISKNTDNL